MCVVGCSLACVCVCVCFSCDQQFISLLQWPFFLLFLQQQITRKVEMGLSEQPQLRAAHSLQLITVTLSLEGCTFSSHWCLDSFLGDDPFQLVSASKLGCNSLLTDVHVKQKNKPQNVKKHKPLHTTSLSSGLNLISILLQAISKCFPCC